MALASQAVANDLAQTLATYEQRGAAVISPQFGAAFRHIGSDALDLLHRLTTNSILDITDGSARRTILTNEKGRIVDVFWVLKRSNEELLLATDSTNPSLMRMWIDRFTIIENAELIDASSFLTRFVVFGDQATHLMLNAFPRANTPVASEFMELGEDNDVLALRTDAAGVATWMIIARCEKADGLLSRFEDLGHNLSGRSLFDYVRITNRIPIVGRELTEDVNPLEAQMRHLIDFDKGCYVGQEVIARLDTYDKVQRSLVGFSHLGMLAILKIDGSDRDR